MYFFAYMSTIMYQRHLGNYLQSGRTQNRLPFKRRSRIYRVSFRFLLAH